MKPFVVKPLNNRLEGQVLLPGDKSIAHRALIISSLANGETRINNLPSNKDCLYTFKALRKLGVKINRLGGKTTSIFSVSVSGKGLYGLSRPKSNIFVGESGTTLRLLLGVLAGQDFTTRLVCGRTLINRPMLRVTQPLRAMGANISARQKKVGFGIEEYPPLTITGDLLSPIRYTLAVASAQVKSAILLAGLYAKGETRVNEPIPTRDHTERMLKQFKARIKLNKKEIVIEGRYQLVSPKQIYVPADISSAAFFLVLAALSLNSRVLIKRVSMNPSRVGIIKVLKRMGADIKIIRAYREMNCDEPSADVLVRGGVLTGTVVRKREIPSLIDELPILMVAACLSKGKTIFEDVQELRAKETDRINSMLYNLKKMGGELRVVKTSKGENIIVNGTKVLMGAKVRSFCDHRTAMSMIVAGLLAKGKTTLDDVTCINKSFPGFIHTLNKLIK